MWPKYPNAEARKAGMRNAPSTSPRRSGWADVRRRACGPSPVAPIKAAPAQASPEDTSMTACQGSWAPTARTACGRAVPSVSMPTSQASVAPARSGAQPTTIFMPMG